MADEKLTNDAEEFESAAEEQVADVVDAVAEDVPTVVTDEQVEEPAADPAGETVAELAEDAAVDERVEAAVQHVAEEAQVDEAAAVVEDTAAAEDEAPRKKRERRSKQARAEKESSFVAPEPPAAKKPSGLAGLGVPAWLAISAACLVLGLVLGRFVLGGGAAGAGNSALAGKTTVAEAELDQAYATYVYKGESDTITVREVAEQNGMLTADADGNYKIPSAEYALNAVRTAILNKEVESRGIEVSDDDIAAYAEEALGTSDYDAIASQYGMEVDAVKELILENCRLTALRKDVIGEDLPAMPEAPAQAEEGKEAEVTKDYADYIINLAGDEWSKKNSKWKSEDSAYATALADTDFTAEGASYNTAQTAYYVAYQKYSEKQSELSTAWTDYLNGLLSESSIQINTLLS